MIHHKCHQFMATQRNYKKGRGLQSKLASPNGIYKGIIIKI